MKVAVQTSWDRSEVLEQFTVECQGKLWEASDGAELFVNVLPWRWPRLRCAAIFAFLSSAISLRYITLASFPAS